jgi:hypothetical protein
LSWDCDVGHAAAKLLERLCVLIAGWQRSKHGPVNDDTSSGVAGHFGLVAWVLAQAALGQGDGSLAEPPPLLRVSGSCPDASAVRSVLAGLLPPNVPSAASATIADHGATYVVGIDDRVKTYSDTSRDCAQRARVAAAFISLALVPDTSPETTSPEPREDVEPPVVPLPAHRPAPSPSVWVRVDARGTGDGALEERAFAPGLVVGVALGRERLGAEISCGWVIGAALSTSAEGSVLLDRFPCAIGPLVRLVSLPWLDLQGSVGIVAGALRARGTGFTSNYDAVRFELGARVSFDAAFPLGPQRAWAIVLGVHAADDFLNYDLDAMPHGVVARTPSLWTGASAGVSWAIP